MRVYTKHIGTNELLLRVERLTFEANARAGILQQILSIIEAEERKELFFEYEKLYQDTIWEWNRSTKEFAKKYLMDFGLHKINWDVDGKEGTVSVKVFCNCNLSLDEGWILHEYKNLSTKN